MIDAVRAGKNQICFICLAIGNLSDYSVVKSLHKFGGFLVDNNTFFFESRFRVFWGFIALGGERCSFHSPSVTF